MNRGLAPLALVALSACGSSVEDATLGPVVSFERDAGLGSSSTSGAGSGPETGGIGAPCEEDATCGGGLQCMRSTDTVLDGGGPAGGYCSKPCTSVEDCGADNRCRILDGMTSMCFEGCKVGKTPNEDNAFKSLDPAKCHGREDVACSASQGGVCLPTCGSDAQCGNRKCDPRLAVCVDVLTTGLPPGASCDPGLATDPCSSKCIALVGGGLCGQPCVFGGVVGTSYDCQGVEHGTCYFVYAGQSGAGDLASCSPACKSQSDCHPPLTWCGHLFEGGGGYCYLGGKCTSTCAGDVAVCTDTPWGKYCTDPSFPLE